MEKTGNRLLSMINGPASELAKFAEPRQVYKFIAHPFMRHVWFSMLNSEVCLCAVGRQSPTNLSSWRLLNYSKLIRVAYSTA